MTTQEVANALIDLCKQGKFMEAISTLYAEDVVSVEAMAAPGLPREMQGLTAVKGKGEWWETNHEVHSVEIEGPLVAGAHFAVTFVLDVTFKPESRKMKMVEIAVYEVSDGKVVHEQFFYKA